MTRRILLQPGIQHRLFASKGIAPVYPFVRMAKEMFIYRNAAPLPVYGTHVSRHRCWPWDLDLWRELNNGRTLTLFDLGRIPLAKRIGLLKVNKRNRWGITVAGASVRYRRRIRLFQTIEMRSFALGFDDRFLYLDQSLWNQSGDCATQALFRMAITSTAGIVPSEKVAKELNMQGGQPDLPEWVLAWIKADATRPWPPQGA